MIVEAKNSKILVVEDDKAWQERYLEMLGPEGEGYEVILADNSNDAIAALDTQHFAFVVVDLKLPQSPNEPEPEFRHGITVIDHILNLASNPPFLINTGYEQNALEIVHGLRQRDIDVLGKSGSVGDLLAKVRQQVRTRVTDVVMKFGGTSLGTPDSISAVADIVVRYVKQTSVPCTVVVSAMSKVTDSLLDCARNAEEGNLDLVQERLTDLRNRHIAVSKELITNSGLQQAYIANLDDFYNDLLSMYQGVAALKEVTLRTLDRISGYGERLSARLLAATLTSRGVDSQSVDATDVIITNDVFGSASPLSEETNQRVKETILPLLEQGVVPVVTGFIANTSDGIPTTLGRGGSDYTATILGAALNSKEVWIWTDVTGIQDADPNLVSDAATITQMSYEEAVKLTYYGAKVLQAKALEPVKNGRIPVRILNTFAPDRSGTLIGPDKDMSYAGAVVVSFSGLGLVTMSDAPDQSCASKIGVKALTALQNQHIEVIEYSQSFSRRTLSIVVRDTDVDRATKILDREFVNDVRDPSQDVTGRRSIAGVSVVGGLDSQPLLVSRILSDLGSAGIEWLGVFKLPSENSFSILVDQNELRETVQAAHAAITNLLHPLSRPPRNSSPKK